MVLLGGVAYLLGGLYLTADLLGPNNSALNEATGSERDSNPWPPPWLAWRGSACLFPSRASFPSRGARHGLSENPARNDAPPPRLATAAEKWQPRELFYITKHGVKLTGMPARQRDDQVWAVVAFLQELAGLDGRQYRQLAYGDVLEDEGAAPVEQLANGDDVPLATARTCARCHGMQGEGHGQGAFPKLAGQSAAYLEDSLAAYAAGQRHSGVREPQAANLSTSDMQRLAQHYAHMPTTCEPAADSLSKAVNQCASIANSGIPARRAPACGGRHASEVGAKGPHYPSLVGQHAPTSLSN